MLKAIFALSFLFSISAHAQSEADLYQLVHEIEDGLDQVTLTPAQIRESYDHLQAARRSIYSSGTPSATLTISDGPTFDFGTEPIGSTQSKLFTITNSGARMAYRMTGAGLSQPFSFRGGSYPGTGGTCSSSLSPGASCSVVVAYAPTAPGVNADALEIQYYDSLANQSASRALQGTATPPASLTLSDGPTYDFGVVRIGTIVDKTFTVTNAGGFMAIGLRSNLSAPYSYPGGFPGIGGTCGRTLNSAATCTIVVRFAPSNPGLNDSAIEITYNDGAAAQSATRDLTGVGRR